jgi:predicted Rossmann fold nucleotide-binding protein DprA/Smf involved in DNA uptake
MDSKHMDDICRELRESTAEISANLIRMEIQGLVKNLGGGVYISQVRK